VSSAKAKVIALLGVSGSGKSIVTRRLLNDHGFQRLRFTDPVRDMLHAGFGLTEDEIAGEPGKRPQDRFGNFSAMHLHRSLCEDWARMTVHSDLLVNEWERRLAPLDGFVLVDDLQRPNEAAAVRRAGGIVIHVDRPGWAPKGGSRKGMSATVHIPHDLQLVNLGTDALASETDRLALQLRQVVA
jgi:hypothetical protein